MRSIAARQSAFARQLKHFDAWTHELSAGEL